MTCKLSNGNSGRGASHRRATAAVRSVKKRLKGLAACMRAGIHPEGGHGTGGGGVTERGGMHACKELRLRMHGA
jgi:hypothetical protein